MSEANGRAAVVLPDNVLIESGAGETVRKQLLDSTDVHTILRLPTGIFYKPGVKANVLFFDNRPGPREVWIHDYRTNVHHTLEKKPLRLKDLSNFIACYNPENREDRRETWSEENPEGRWRRFTYDEIMARDKTNLDIFWLKHKSLADEIIENLEAGLKTFREGTAIISNPR